MEFFDNHTLYVKCKIATASQLKSSFDLFIKDASSKLGRPIPCNVTINLVENREGKSFGFAFVFVSNPEVYNILLGLNPDGTERISMIDDPSWVAPQVSFESSKTSSWADISEEEDSMIAPKISTKLGPVATLPLVKLTEEQRHTTLSDNMIYKIDTNKDTIELEVSRASVPKLGIAIIPNALKCKDVPEWITIADLKDSFLPFASDSKSLHDVMFRKQSTTEAYPIVVFNKDDAYIIFNPETKDAQFCLHMLKKLTIKRDKESATLIFFNASGNDRDITDKVRILPHQDKVRILPHQDNARKSPHHSTSPRNTKNVVREKSVKSSSPKKEVTKFVTKTSNNFSMLPEDD